MLFIINQYLKPRSRKKWDRPIWSMEIQGKNQIQAMRKAGLENGTNGKVIEIYPVPTNPRPYRIDPDGIV
jgi:hypothetical protein